MEKTPEQLVQDYRADIKKDADVTREQREAANEDMRFIHVKGGQWEDWLYDSDDNRVRMEFDLVADFLSRFLARFDTNPVGVDFKPDDAATSDDDAELLNGLYRSDFRINSGAVALDNAIEEAATCGIGAFKLATEFEDEEDPENENQRIEWRPIYNAYNVVYWDPAAKRIDKKDARYCHVLEQYTKDSFEAQYPNAKPISAYVPDNWHYSLGSYNNLLPELVFVASRYEVKNVVEPFFVYNNFESGEVETYSKEKHAAEEGRLRASEVHRFVRKRNIKRRTVEKSVFNGDEFLEEPRRVVGKHIPVVPVYGHRVYVDGSEYYRGLVRRLKDPQRAFNVNVSQLAENAASAGQEVPIFAREQMESDDVKGIWAKKNNQPYLIVDPLEDANGNPVAQGPIGYNKPAQLDASTQGLLQIIPQYMRETTGGAPQETLNPDASGKAIKALMEREDAKTVTVVKNIKDAVRWSGEVYQSMAAEVYATPRAIRITGKDDTIKSVNLMEMTVDPKTRLVIETNTLQNKRFRAYPDIGPQYDTLREETVENAKGAIEALSGTPAGQAYIPALIGVMIENSTGVGMDALKRLNRRNMLMQGLIQPESEEDMEMLQQIAQQQQQPDPQQLLIAAAAQQQQAEAQNLQASAAQKLADARKKEAETVEIYTDIGNNETRLVLDAQKQVTDQRDRILQSLQALPVTGT